MRNKYPTWRRVNSKLVVSEEQLDGTPDVFIERDGKYWYAKCRTSACWSGPYVTAAIAMKRMEGTFKA